MSLREWFAKLNSFIGKGVDGYTINPNDSLAAAQFLLSEYVAEVVAAKNRKDRDWWYFEVRPDNYKHGKKILECPPEDQIGLVQAMFVRLTYYYKKGYNSGAGDKTEPIFPLLLRLMARKLPYTEADLLIILKHIVKNEHVYWRFPLKSLLNVISSFTAQHRLSEAMRDMLKQLSKKEFDGLGEADTRRLLTQIRTILGELREGLFDEDEEWAKAVNQEMTDLEDSQRTVWQALLAHCRTAAGSKASAKWLKQAEALVEQIGKENFAERVSRWFARVSKPSEKFISDRNETNLKGLLWCSLIVNDPHLCMPAGDLAIACFNQKVEVQYYGRKPRSLKVGNACVWALSEMRGMEPVLALSRVKLKVKLGSVQKMIEDALERAAERAGLSREEMEELAVPTFGLEADGVRRETLGSHTVELCFEEKSPKLSVYREGKTLKSVPAEIKNDYAEEWKDLQNSLKEIRKALPVQRERIERLLLSDRSLPLTAWRERYLDHPLLLNMARRLIWYFRSGEKTGLGAWHEGQMIDVHDRPFEWLDENTEVRLWHPIGFEPGVVFAWREWLDRHQVQQPFKQAHREVYILTDAELNTRTYSNRFAAHFLKQYPFVSLARLRGWQCELRGSFDRDYYPPSLILPRWGLRAEFWVESVWENDRFSDSGIYFHITTDQVRFYKMGEDHPIPLTEVPVLVFSEVMRDVDLFVGVCSVGNDPNWEHRGEEGIYGDYWRSYSFGDLSASAETRKEILQRLLPRLKIAARSRIEGRFLIVRGDLRTYKIHLGSGNILMEPNDQYLCIVPDARQSEKGTGSLFLPFEGDRTLSIILSKAFLLSEDKKITDPTITRQIK